MRNAYFFDTLSNEYYTLQELYIEWLYGSYGTINFEEYIGSCIICGTIKEVDVIDYRMELQHESIIHI